MYEDYYSTVGFLLVTLTIPGCKWYDFVWGVRNDVRVWSGTVLPTVNDVGLKQPMSPPPKYQPVVSSLGVEPQTQYPVRGMYTYEMTCKVERRRIRRL